MKKIYLLLIAVVFAVNLSYAQWTTGTGGNYYLTSGSAGIGTVSPSLNSKLHVAGGDVIVDNGGTGLLRGDNYNYGRGGAIKFSSQNNSTGSWLALGQAASGSGAFTPMLFINDGGNVGIGTTTPGYKLEVNGNMGGRGQMGNGSTGQWYEVVPYEIGTDNNAGWTGTMIGVRTGGMNNTSTPITQNIAANSPAYQQAWAMTFGTDKNQTNGSAFSIWTGDATNPGTAMSEIFRIKSNGNVGIGTTSPGSATKLQVAGAGLFTGGAPDPGDGTPLGVHVGYYSTGNYGFIQSIQTGVAYASLILQPQGGNIGIGTSSPDQKLTVKGTIHSQEVIVDMSVLPDYVFKPAYHLPALTEVKAYIDQNHRLPEMPSAEQVEKDGLSLGDMNAKLLKKVEELTLYLIEKDNKDKEKEAQLISQQKEIDELKNEVSSLIKSKP